MLSGYNLLVVLLLLRQVRALRILLLAITITNTTNIKGDFSSLSAVKYGIVPSLVTRLLALLYIYMYIHIYIYIYIYIYTDMHISDFLCMFVFRSGYQRNST